MGWWVLSRVILSETTTWDLHPRCHYEKSGVLADDSMTGDRDLFKPIHWIRFQHKLSLHLDQTLILSSTNGVLCRYQGKRESLATASKNWGSKKNRHQKMATKNRKAQKPRLLCAPAFSFVDPSLLFDVCCGLSQKILATPKQITIIFSNHFLVVCFLSYLWRHKKWFWWNRSVIYRSLKSPHLQSLCYIKTGMKLHISSNSWPPAPKTWTWQH